MYAMQYQVGLPADYNMQIIRDRVKKTGHLMDGFAGLEFKAYLIREKSKGAGRNVYAPFYVWRNIDGMRSFCWGEPGYSAIVRDFGRQPIQDWTIHRIVKGPISYADAHSLTLTTVSLPVDIAPSLCLDSVTQDFLNSVADSTVTLVTAVDVTNWNAIFVELSNRESDQSMTSSLSYEVLHVSYGS